MIGFEYNGEVNYITRIEDFREFMESSVYEAVAKAFEDGLGEENYRKKYEELESDYESLESDYEDLQYAADELESCETQLDDVTEKFETFKHAIEVLIAQYHQRYIKQEEVIPTLEKMDKTARIKEFLDILISTAIAERKKTIQTA